MGSRSVFFLALAAFLVALGVAKADGDYHKPADDYYKPHHPKEYCFLKKQKCCYKFVPCGYKIKKIPITKKCDFKKCEYKCKKVCKKRKVKVAYKHCYVKPVKFYVKKCGKHYPGGHYDDDDDDKYEKDDDKYEKDDDKYDDKYDHKDDYKGDSVHVTRSYEHYPKYKKCKKVAVIKHKKVCEKKYKYIAKPHCEKKCYKDCYLYKAICKGYKLVKFLKYCPKLYCDKVEGDKHEPKPYIGKKVDDGKEEIDDKKILGKKLIKGD